MGTVATFPGGPDLGEFTEAIMDNDALRRLRFDTRLKGRRGWTSQEEFEEELAKLPDVSEKVKLLDEEDRAADGPSGQADAPEMDGA